MEQKPVSIKPADLQIDLRNPRIESESLTPREALRTLAKEQEEHLVVLAEHIVSHRQLNPAELPIVMRSEENPKRYTVLEGNRRLTALRVLEAPDTFNGAVEPRHLDKLRKLSAQYHKAPIKEVYCVIAKDREEAEPWIRVRHNGQNGGAGVVDWGSDEKARFSARSGGAVSVHTRVLNFLQEGGHLSASDRRNIPTTTLERMLKSSDIRKAVGLAIEKGGAIHFPAGESGAIKALLQMISELITGKTKVQHVYTKDQRTKYAEEFPAALRQEASSSSGAPGPPTGSGVSSTKKSPPVRIPPSRNKIIPHDCYLKVKDAKVRAIEIELRGLLLEDNPNAIAVLFRVFLELSVDYYRTHTMRRDQYAVKAHLSDKLLDVAADLEAKNKLTKWEVNPVKAAAHKGSFLVPSVVMMHEVIHNLHMNPSPTDLRAQWDNLQPFIVAMWPR